MSVYDDPYTRITALEAQLAEAEQTWKNQQAITRDEMKRADEYQEAYRRAETDHEKVKAQRDALAEALREIASEVRTRSTGVRMSGEIEWPTPLHRSVYERAHAALAEAGLE